MRQRLHVGIAEFECHVRHGSDADAHARTGFEVAQGLEQDIFTLVGEPGRRTAAGEIFAVARSTAVPPGERSARLREGVRGGGGLLRLWRR